jgi:HAE1 family hydrophobic/amphiphilic exporter-1
MMVGAFLVLGLYSFFNLPEEQNPQVDFPTVSITTSYSGVNPQEMESLITRPIENAIAGVSGIQEIDSTSQIGTSRVQVQFYFGTNIDTASAQVQQNVDKILRSLPTGASLPSVLQANTSSQPVLNLSMVSDTMSPVQLRSIADNQVVPALEEGNDVGGVNDFGGDVRQINVYATNEKLASLGITISDLATAVNQSNVNVATGFIQHGQNYYNVQFQGQFATVAELQHLRLSMMNDNQQPITFRLGDIANVQDGIQEETNQSYVNGRRSVNIVVQKTSDGNTLTAVQSSLQQLERIKKFLPPGITFVETNNQATTVRENINDVTVSLMLGALMAILVIYCFLHNILGTIIVAIALPTSMIATFLPLMAFGMTLNTMSLMGLSLAVGILVDDSIVVLENINRHLTLGEEPVEAAINGRSEIGLAALTLTAVDLVVFLPIAFMGGVIGEFFRSFGITVACATLFSLFVSFTLTPMLAARWYKKGEKFEYTSGFGGWFDARFFQFEAFYQRMLRGALRHPWIVLGVGNLILIAVFLTVGPAIGFRFAPNQDQNLVAVTVEGPPGASLQYTQQLISKIQGIIRSTPSLNNNIKFISATIGRSAQGGPGAGLSGTQYANLQCTLYDKKSVLDSLNIFSHQHLRSESDVQVSLDLRKALRNVTGARILASNVTGFGGGGAPFEIDLTGPSMPQILAATQTVENMVKNLPGTYNVDISYQNSQPEVDVRLDRIKAADYGLTVQQVAQALSNGVEGNQQATYYMDPTTGQEYFLNIQLDYPDRQSPQQVGDIVVGYKSNAPIHLSDVANVSIGAGPTQLQRLNRQEEVAVTAYLLPGYQVGNVGQAANAQLAKMNLGQVAYSQGGENKSIAQEGGYLAVALVLGIILTYMLMAALFNNVVYPFSIMLSLPQAWCGALIALWIAQEPLSLIAMIGIVLLNGIVNKNAILLVDYTNTLRRRGYKRIDALLEAGPTRLRPIMMTSITILVSSLPTALALGRGAGFRQSLGVAVIGGVSLSLMLTLIVVPCAYLIFDNLTNFISRVLWHQRIPTTDQVGLTRERPDWGAPDDGHGTDDGHVWPAAPGEEYPVGAGVDRRIDSGNGHSQDGDGHATRGNGHAAPISGETEPEEEIVED